MTKQQVKQPLAALTYDFDGPIEDAIKMLEGYRDKVEGRQVFLEYEDISGRYDPDTRMGIQLYYMRDETDAEYAKRLADEATRKERQDAWEKQQYERLREKFEKGVTND